MNMNGESEQEKEKSRNNSFVRRHFLHLLEQRLLHVDVGCVKTIQPQSGLLMNLGDFLG